MVIDDPVSSLGANSLFSALRRLRHSLRLPLFGDRLAAQFELGSCQAFRQVLGARVAVPYQRARVSMASDLRQFMHGRYRRQA
ncbi:MAG: hypothetical protein HY778_13120 [Betaproteobacteria bacterium]|nr:hypothetical protein [Betaproteobacteria bacterium]